MKMVFEKWFFARVRFGGETRARGAKENYEVHPPKVNNHSKISKCFERVIPDSFRTRNFHYIKVHECVSACYICDVFEVTKLNFTNHFASRRNHFLGEHL